MVKTMVKSVKEMPSNNKAAMEKIKPMLFTTLTSCILTGDLKMAKTL